MTYFATYFYYSKDKEKHGFCKIGEIEWEWLQQGVSIQRYGLLCSYKKSI